MKQLTVKEFKPLDKKTKFGKDMYSVEFTDGTKGATTDMFAANEIAEVEIKEYQNGQYTNYWITKKGVVLSDFNAKTETPKPVSEPKTALSREVELNKEKAEIEHKRSVEEKELRKKEEEKYRAEKLKKDIQIAKLAILKSEALSILLKELIIKKNVDLDINIVKGLCDDLLNYVME